MEGRRDKMDLTAQLRAAAIPLVGADPSLAEDDLAPLLERLTGARLIGLGEATHGDHESFAFKCRLIQALVRRGHCDVVIFERGVAEMDAYDRYVTGETDALPTMGDELYPWRVEEVRDLFVWLRGWNAAGGAVHVAGMDMQSPRGLPLALRLLDEVGIAPPAVWRRIAAEVDERKRDLAWLEATLATWQERAPPPLDLSDPRQRWIALLARTFSQWLETWACWVRPDRDRYGPLRECHMAENAVAQLDRIGPTSTGAIWAHNAHVYVATGMSGNRLKENLKTHYRSVCFFFGQGSFNAGSVPVDADTGKPGPVDWTLRSHPAQLPPPESMEGVLNQLDLDCYAVPASAVPGFWQGRPFRGIGAALADGPVQFSAFAFPAYVYDLVVYFREVRPSRLLGTTT